MKNVKHWLAAALVTAMFLTVSTMDYNDQKMMEEYKQELRK